MFRPEFPDSIDEIERALKKENTAGYDYRKAIVDYMSTDSGEILAASISVEKSVKKYTVREIIWFAVCPKSRKRNIGSVLFKRIYSSAKRSKSVDAILVSSTNRALSFWLTRRGVPMFRQVLRETPAIPVAKGETPYHLRKLFKPQTKRADPDVIALGQRGHSLFSICSGLPSDSVLALYTDQVWRNRKGRVSKSTTFQGRPYRYGISSSSHIWYPISRRLVRALGKSGQGAKSRGRKKMRAKAQTAKSEDSKNILKAHVLEHPRRRRFWSSDFDSVAVKSPLVYSPKETGSSHQDADARKSPRWRSTDEARTSHESSLV